MTLTGRVALVTGGGRGIGRSTALALARGGADVAVAARSRKEIDSVAEEVRAVGRRAVAIPCDVGERSDVERMVKSAETELGPIEILVNNAGVAASASKVDRFSDFSYSESRERGERSKYADRAVDAGPAR